MRLASFLITTGTLILVSPAAAQMAHYLNIQVPLRVYREELLPKPGVERIVVTGQAVYVEARQEEHKVAVLLEDVQVTAPKGKKKQPIVLWAGTPLYGIYRINNTGDHRYCSQQLLKDNGYGWLCLKDRDYDGRFDKIYASRYRPAPTLDVPYRFDSVEITSHHPEVPVHGFRKELLYQGAGGGVLRLSYREFQNDFARPAFTQELTYDLAAEGPTDIAFKTIRIRVLEASNQGIRYEVLTGD